MWLQIRSRLQGTLLLSTTGKPVNISIWRKKAAERQPSVIHQQHKV
jgi:hypothetical protein